MRMGPAMVEGAVFKEGGGGAVGLGEWAGAGRGEGAVGGKVEGEGAVVDDAQQLQIRRAALTHLSSSSRALASKSPMPLATKVFFYQC